MRLVRGSSLPASALASLASFHVFLVASRLSALVAAIPVLGGCATLITGTSQDVRFDSSPPGAEVLVNGTPSGITPTTLTVHRDGETVVTFSKPGYAPQALPLPTRIEPSFWLDIALLSPIAIAVDLSDRADLTFSQGQYAATLLPQNPQPVPSVPREQQAQGYIDGNYEALGNEVRKRKGEHLEQLVDLLNVGIDARPDAKRILQDLYYVNHSKAAFASAVILKFGLKDPDPSQVPVSQADNPGKHGT
jgi:PEGA domain-containing protein